MSLAKAVCEMLIIWFVVICKGKYEVGMYECNVRTG